MSDTIKLTPRAVAYAFHQEGLVREAYKDSEGVWTWAGGVTNASGHEVYPRYKDNPQTLEHCLEITVWLMRSTYLAAVQRAFAGSTLNEAQVAAALSFQWNTGAITATEWVCDWKAGKPASARSFLTTHYLNGGDLTERRKSEAALFFDGHWPGDLRCPVYPVRKPSYTPNFGKRELIDLVPTLEAMGGWK